MSLAIRSSRRRSVARLHSGLVLMSKQPPAFLFLATCLLAACSSDAHKDPTTQGMDRHFPADFADAARCKALGGVMGAPDGFQASVCDTSIPDGGKSCTDKAQCQGLCLAPEHAMTGDRVTGTCQKRTDDSGCHTMVVAGVTGGTDCD